MFTLVATTSATPCRISFIPKRKCLILFQMCKTVLRNVLVFLVEVNGLQCFLQNIFSCVPKKKEFFRTTIDCSISVAQTSFFFLNILFQDKQTDSFLTRLPLCFHTKFTIFNSLKYIHTALHARADLIPTDDSALFLTLQ